ncbi:MAG: MBL fold metallo-hydrolase [Promethearchaeota archaeon]|jgi:L-ascorbate metabolism protein UlaG (beta-lactamase superfamily)
MRFKTKNLGVITLLAVFGIAGTMSTILLLNSDRLLDEFEYKGVNIQWFLCEAIKLKKGNTVVYIDPRDIPDQAETADYIIITHDHVPHVSNLDIIRISDGETIIISQPFVSGRDYAVNPYDSLVFSDVSFEFVHMYNINKFRNNGNPFHIKGQGVGVVIDFGVVRIYHAGDTDHIPEMLNIRADIALLPVTGYAWMTAQEAAKAVEYLKVSSDLKLAIPIHWGPNGVGGITGSYEDALRFQSLANCPVLILDALSA